MKKATEWLAVGLPLALGIISIAISIMRFIGVLPGPPSLIPSLTLGLLGLVATYLAIERITRLNNIERLVQEIHRTNTFERGGPLKVLPNDRAVYEYVTQRLREVQSKRRAECHIDDLSWARVAIQRTSTEEAAYKAYRSALVATASEDHVTYREIMSFPDPTRAQRAYEMLSQKLDRYELAYYEVGEGSPPLLSFMVIDSGDPSEAKEVILAFYKTVHEEANPEIHLAIQNPTVAQLFQQYYDAIWGDAKKIKEIGKPPQMNVLQEFMP